MTGVIRDMPDSLLTDVAWADATTSGKDIHSALLDCYDVIMDSLGAPQSPDITVVVSSSFYHRYMTWHARQYWKSLYRMARFIGEREWATKKIGSQRRGFV